MSTVGGQAPEILLEDTFLTEEMGRSAWLGGPVARLAVRLAAGVVLLVAVSLLSFVLLYSIGNPARAVGGEAATNAQIEKITEQFGFDRPVVVQYWDWLSHAVRGDFGTTFQSGQRPVTEVIMQRLPTSLALAAGAVLLSVIVAVACGFVIGRWPASAADRGITALANLSAAIPPYFLGSLLALLFAVQLGLFPPAGYVPISDGVLRWASFMVLPWITLAMGLVGQQVRTLRASLLKELDSDYVRTARMKGVGEGTILRRHVARNAVLPYLTVLGLQTPRLITSALFVEAVFAVPGIGSLLVVAVQERDLPLVQGLVVMVSAAVILANILVDLSYEVLNPLARSSEEKVA
ncbi:MAG: ABC transporter permease [Actinobacteria bacterium]|nr:ABC transporter permease [Actinomycetota bacterium]